MALLISRCAIYGQLYLTDDDPEDAKGVAGNLRRGLLILYTAILQAVSIGQGVPGYDPIFWGGPSTPM